MQMLRVTVLCVLTLPAHSALAGSITVAAAQTQIRWYTTSEQFREHMGALVEQAMAASPDLIVFPEDVGTGLLALGAPESIREADSLGAAMQGLVNLHAQEVMALAGQGVPLPPALVLVQAQAVRQAYVATFSALAAQHGVHIAAGTILLPHEDAQDRAVYNTFMLFGPTGEVIGTADKVNLIPLERDDGLMLTPGDRDALAPWQTPLGVLGPVICFDAWDAGLVGSLVQAGAQLLVCPSANPEPWTEDVRQDRLDGLYSRVAQLGVPGVECFAVGELAGLPFQGVTWIIAPDPGAEGGVRVLAQAQTHDAEEIVTAEVELPARAAE